MPVPTQANERWSVDLMSDQLANGRRFRILNLIDNFSRQCVGQIVDTSISGARLARYLDELSTTRPLPRTLVLDNGPEFTSKALFFLLGPENRCPAALHPARKADSECLRRELQRQV